MARTGVLNKVFDHSIDSLARSTIFIGAFTSRALKLLQLTRQVAHVSKTRKDETADVWRLMAKTKRFSSAKGGSLWPLPPPLSSTSDQRDCQKHCRTHRKTSAPKLRDYESRTNPKDRYYTASSDQVTRNIVSAHDSHIPDLSGNARTDKVPRPLVTSMDQALLALQTMKRHYAERLITALIALIIAQLTTTKRCQAIFLGHEIWSSPRWMRTSLIPVIQFPSSASSRHY